MRVKTDLTKRSNTIGYVLVQNYDQLMSLKSTPEIVSKVQNLLSVAGINTPASTRLLFNLNRSKSLVNSLSIISNTVLAAQGNAVYK